MKHVTSFLFAGALLLASFSSCEKSDIQQQQTATPAVKKAASHNDSAFPQVTTEKCAAPTFNLSPCDRTFTFTATRGGAVDTFNFYYEVRTAAGVLVDWGYISNGMSTHPVLNYCTSYNVTIYDWCVGGVTLTRTSDGCNNTFFC